LEEIKTLLEYAISNNNLNTHPEVKSEPLEITPQISPQTQISPSQPQTITQNTSDIERLQPQNSPETLNTPEISTEPLSDIDEEEKIENAELTDMINESLMDIDIHNQAISVVPEKFSKKSNNRLGKIGKSTNARKLNLTSLRVTPIRVQTSLAGWEVIYKNHKKQVDEALRIIGLHPSQEQLQSFLQLKNELKMKSSNYLNKFMKEGEDQIDKYKRDVYKYNYLLEIYKKQGGKGLFQWTTKCFF